MKREYTRPEIEITLFATESIMDSATGSDSAEIEMEVNSAPPAEIPADTWNL